MDINKKGFEPIQDANSWHKLYDEEGDGIFFFFQ